MQNNRITVITPNGQTVINAQTGAVLINVLSDAGFALTAACGRKGSCGKCRVQLISGEFENEKAENGMIRSCRAAVKEDAVILVDFDSGIGLTDFADPHIFDHGFCGIAVDIGTTTVAASLLKKDGTRVSRSCLNPQSVYGADVVSRIEACQKGALTEQTGLILACIQKLINELDPDQKAGQVIVSGNTAMLHIFCGVSPVSMGAFPFTPGFTDAKQLNGELFGLNNRSVTVLPSVSAYIGSDIVAGIYALGLNKTDKNVLFADLGTNGELVLSRKGTLFCTATAAGPALEGACIACGMGGVSGAVSKVFITGNQEIGYFTVNGAPPKGLCGAGLIDAVALLIKSKKLEETGFLENDFYIAPNVYVTQKDIRQFQLAKSAVYSGMETLCEKAKISIKEIDALCVAGGLGYYIDPQSACITGLIPCIQNSKAVGNTSLLGALMCLTRKNGVEEMRKIAKSCTFVDLGGDPGFNKRFTEHMLFEL